MVCSTYLRLYYVMQSIYTIKSIFLIRIGFGTNANREECLKARPNE